MIKIGKDGIQVAAKEYKGKWYVHIRKWYEQEGELKPGKGIALKEDDWNEFIEKFEKIKKDVKDEIEE